MSLTEPSIGRTGPARLRVGSVELDTLRRRATVGGQIVDISETAYMALEVLVLHRGTTLNSRAIVEYVFNDEMQDPRIVAVIMFRIIRALVQAGAPDLIAPVLGEGYRVNAQETAVSTRSDCSQLELGSESGMTMARHHRPPPGLPCNRETASRWHLRMWNADSVYDDESGGMTGSPTTSRWDRSLSTYSCCMGEII